MQGLKTQESSKFLKFFKIVQEEAAKLNSVFFLDCGEGREFENENLEGEDLSGWVIPTNMINEFEPEFEKDEVSERWVDFVRFVIWNENKNTISIHFKSY